MNGRVVISTNEGTIDARIARVVRFGLDSELSLKKACIVAASVVGTYSGVTQEIAKRTKRSVSTIENWAHAFRLYEQLRKFNHDVSWCLWRELPASHWWLAYDIQAKGYDALHYLTMAEHHSWSGRDMMQEFKRDFEAGNAPMIRARALLSFRGLADELMAGLSAPRREQAERLLREFVECIK